MKLNIETATREQLIAKLKRTEADLKRIDRLYREEQNKVYEERNKHSEIIKTNHSFYKDLCRYIKREMRLRSYLRIAHGRLEHLRDIIKPKGIIKDHDEQDDIFLTDETAAEHKDTGREEIIDITDAKIEIEKLLRSVENGQNE